jgi:hypothetical protein
MYVKEEGAIRSKKGEWRTNSTVLINFTIKQLKSK